ncbi:Ig-like domain-containing protein, partial [Peribacillus frigoritolerans]
GTAKADSKGNFSIKISKKKAGSALYVSAKDKAGNTGKATKVTVKKSK